MEVEGARPKQKTSRLAPTLAVLLIVLVVLTLIGVGLALAGPAYAGHTAL
ncbi:MAG: hypothetical protein OXI26_04935 [bacterium]|nr:hypothetical protein [bacterium]